MFIEGSLDGSLVMGSVAFHDEKMRRSTGDPSNLLIQKSLNRIS
jgi:hypothetical protein